MLRPNEGKRIHSDTVSRHGCGPGPTSEKVKKRLAATLGCLGGIYKSFKVALRGDQCLERVRQRRVHQIWQPTYAWHRQCVSGYERRAVTPTNRQFIRASRLLALHLNPRSEQDVYGSKFREQWELEEDDIDVDQFNLHALDDGPGDTSQVDV
ncbi:unnamed protein product [Phytophthora fragariaefolia]|uniref:Unnamed protein product n=1 Tax=Phytophthora fragariaefolia TaxID=1490495 RepID=A0A9W7CT26_9STRA|nr:unnamed protein product [Phytophthora fragariaefolia]